MFGWMFQKYFFFVRSKMPRSQPVHPPKNPVAKCRGNPGVDLFSSKLSEFPKYIMAEPPFVVLIRHDYFFKANLAATGSIFRRLTSNSKLLT
jgi:hypothetical protein